MAETRGKLHALIDALPDAQLHAAQRFLEYLWWTSDDPLAALLRSAPIDDEPTTAEEEAGAAQAREEMARGEVMSLEEVKRALLS